MTRRTISPLLIAAIGALGLGAVLVVVGIAALAADVGLSVRSPRSDTPWGIQPL